MEQGFETGRVGKVHVQDGPVWFEVLNLGVFELGMVGREHDVVTISACGVGIRIALAAFEQGRRAKRRVQDRRCACLSGQRSGHLKGYKIPLWR